MPGATHNPNISGTVILGASPPQVTGFGTVLLMVPLAANSLGGARVLTLTSYEDAEDARTAGTISAATLLACNVAFSQRPKIDEFKLGYVDLVLVKAEKDFGTVGGGDFDTIIEATTGGQDGNLISVALVLGAALGIVVTGDAVVITVNSGVSTVAQVEAAITALSGANDIIDVKTAGTGATVIGSGDAFAATLLAGGSGETYSNALTACRAFDSDFYGVCIDSRVAAPITALGATIEASDKRMLFVAQNASASWLAAGLPAGITGDRERVDYVYHSSDAAWNDVAWAVNRLSFDPDETSAPWNGHELAEVAAVTTMTAAQRLLLIGNDCNVGLPFGSADFVMDPGVNSAGRPIYEIVSTDWFIIRADQRIADLIVARANRGQKLAVTPIGQTLVRAVIEGLYAQAVAVGHFVAPDEDDNPVVFPTLTNADRAARRIPFTVRGQIAVGGRNFSYTLYASTDALSA